MKRLILILPLMLLTGAVGPVIQATQTWNDTSSSHEWKFDVLGMSCESCAKSAVEALGRGIAGISTAAVDFTTKQGSISSGQPVSKDQIREALAALGFEARFPEDPPQPPPIPESERNKLDIKTISRGEAVRIEDHVVLGKHTIFDYYADWCAPCHLLTPRLERLVQEHKQVALRKVDIGDWETAAGKQATRDFKLAGLPYVRVYGPDGNLLGAVQGNHIVKIRALIGADGPN